MNLQRALSRTLAREMCIWRTETARNRALEFEILEMHLRLTENWTICRSSSDLKDKLHCIKQHGQSKEIRS